MYKYAFLFGTTFHWTKGENKSKKRKMSSAISMAVGVTGFFHKRVIYWPYKRAVLFRVSCFNKVFNILIVLCSVD